MTNTDYALYTTRIDKNKGLFLSNEHTQAHLEDEAAYYITLGTLLQKKRNTVQTAQVESIIHSNVPLTQKILQIEKLDREEAVQGTQRVTQSRSMTQLHSMRQGTAQTPSRYGFAPHTQKLSNTATDNIKKSVDETAQNRMHSMAPVSRSSLFQFFFRERKKIAEFAQESSIISVQFFSLSPHLNKKAIIDFDDFIKTKLLPVAKQSVQAVLKNGWKIVRKYEYNIIAAYSRLLFEIEQLNVHTLIDGTMPDPHQTFILENYFIALHAKSDILHILFSALYDALESSELKKQGESSAAINTSKAVSTAKQILIAVNAQPCLYNFIIALNIIRSRRFLTMEHLIQPQSGILFSSQEFDCTAEVQEAINIYIQDLVTQMEELQKKRLDLSISRYFPRTNQNSIDYTPLKKLLSPESAAEAQDDIIKCIISILEKWDRRFASVLQSPITTTQTKIIRLLNEGVITYEIDKLHYLSDMLSKSVKGLSYGRYKSLKIGVSQVMSYEAENIQILSSISDIFWKIGSKIAEHLQQLYTEKENSAFSILDCIIFNEKTGSSTAEHLLHEAASISFSITQYLQNERAQNMLNEEWRLNNEMIQTLKTVERLASSEQYTAIRNCFALFDA